MTPALSMRQAVHFTLPELADVFNRAFDGYIAGTVKMDTAQFAGFLTGDGTDLNASLLAVRDDEPVGIGLVARRGWSCRLAAMGIVPEAKGQGEGKWLMSKLIDEARARGDHTYLLEVFEQNTPAVKLYEGSGFQVVRRLYGYTGRDLRGTLSDGLEQIDIVDVAHVVARYGLPDLPWQMTGAAFYHMTAPYVGFRLGHAYAILTNPQNPVVGLRALIVPPEQRGQGHATRMVNALIARYPGKTWAVPALCPEEYGGYFQHLGFAPQPLNQFQMKMDL